MAAIQFSASSTPNDAGAELGDDCEFSSHSISNCLVNDNYVLDTKLSIINTSTNKTEEVLTIWNLCSRGGK